MGIVDSPALTEEFTSTLICRQSIQGAIVEQYCESLLSRHDILHLIQRRLVSEFYKNRGGIIKQFPNLPCREFCDMWKKERKVAPSHCMKERHGSSCLFSDLILNALERSIYSFQLQIQPIAHLFQLSVHEKEK